MLKKKTKSKSAKRPAAKKTKKAKKKSLQGFQKGRGHPDAVLNEQQVRDLRAGKYEHMTQNSLARKWGVSSAAISFARTGASWAHLPGAQKPRPRGVRAGGKKGSPSNARTKTAKRAGKK
jgi:hypothetical protein